jgi:hypothetical protein
MQGAVAWIKDGEGAGRDESRSNHSVKRFDITRDTEGMSSKTACMPCWSVPPESSVMLPAAASSSMFLRLAELMILFWFHQIIIVPLTMISWNRDNSYLRYCTWSSNYTKTEQTFWIALQRLWALAAFQFPDLFTVGRTPLMSDHLVARPLLQSSVSMTCGTGDVSTSLER